MASILSMKVFLFPAATTYRVGTSLIRSISELPSQNPTSRVVNDTRSSADRLLRTEPQVLLMSSFHQNMNNH
jgi:hypothetical protein